MKKSDMPVLSPQTIGVLTGPTATGKSSIALEWARKEPRLELINADSLLIYRQMDIGTAKPLPKELVQVPHHLVNIRNPDEPFTAGDFVRETEKAITSIQSRGKKPLIVGGSGFYLKALLWGLWAAPAADAVLRKTFEIEETPMLYEKLLQRDPQAALRIGKTDRYRLIRALELVQLTGRSFSDWATSSVPDPRFQLWVVDRNSDELLERIHLRTAQMLQLGFLEECQTLNQNFPASRAFRAVGYAQAFAYLAGRLPEGRKIAPGLSGLQSEIELATRQLVKTQRTWFRGQLKPFPRVQTFCLDADRGALEKAWEAVYCQELMEY